MYMVDLRRGDSPVVVVNAMKQLLDQRRIVAVPLSIGGPTKPKSNARPPSASLAKSISPTQPLPIAESSTASVVIARDVSPGTSPTAKSPVVRPDGEGKAVEGELSDDDLDALVYDLNASDW